VGWKALLVAALAASASLLFALVLRHLSHPVLWNDEAETIVYAERILDFGYPKVHDGRNVVYELTAPISIGVKEGQDAYIGSTWGQYYFGTPGAAWARSVSDPYEKTWRVRLPFALAGLLGVGVLLWVGTSGLAGDVSAQLGLSALALLLVALSPSHALHLREARHYPLVVLLVACCLWVYVRFHVLRRMAYATYCGLLAILLFVTFNVFSLPWVGLCAGFGLDQLWRLQRSRPVGREAIEGFAWAVAPLALSVALLLPVWIYFETFRIARHLGASHGKFAYLEHIGITFAYLLNYELLAPAACAKVLSWLSLRSVPHDRRSQQLTRTTETSHLFWLVISAYLACTLLLPFSFERYVTVLVPMLALMLVLDGWTVFAVARAPRITSGARWAKPAVVGLWMVCAAWLLPQRIAEFPSRLEEWETPYRGPIDYAVEYVRAFYEHPERLVIATNYEAPSLLYYLGSKVTVGYAWANLLEDLATPPDIIIERRWGTYEPLRELEKAGKFEVKAFEVLDLPINNVPQVSPTRMIPMTHQYRTPLAESPEGAFKILVRSPGPR
jgi:hypothetical protein